MIHESLAQLLLQITIYLGSISQLVLFVCAWLVKKRETERKIDRERQRERERGNKKEMNYAQSVWRDSKFALSVDVNETPAPSKGPPNLFTS